MLGFDIFIDSKLKAWLFEINDHPSLNIFLEKEGDPSKEISEIDKHVKMKVLGDAICLMKKKNLDRVTTERYKGYHRVLPDSDF